MNGVLKKSRIRFVLAVLVAVALLGLALLALRPREPAYHGKRLSAWIEDLSEPQRSMETLANVELRWQKLTNVVRVLGTETLPSAVGWIRDKRCTQKHSSYHNSMFTDKTRSRASIRTHARS
jgi:hypothetical protein